MFNNPEFYQFPIQNNRTGHKPVYLPFILVVPNVRTTSGTQIANANPTGLKFYIESVQGQAKVAGVEHKGLLIPNIDLYTVNIPLIDLFDMMIYPINQTFLDAYTNESKEFDDAQDGDLMEVTLRNGNIRSTIPYYQHTDYYDLSTTSITTVDLKPTGQYKFIWQVTFFERLISVDEEFISIDETSEIINKSSIIFSHPGDVHQSMVSNTPQMYLDGTTLDKDNLVNFYRPLADALQDIFDEQQLLLGINWIDKIPAQYMPYLAYLLGWDLPYFDSSTDEMRRVVLKNARRLQELKGTKRVIVELFEMLGFTIDVANLWYRSDGNKFLAPNENPPASFSQDKITTTNAIITDLIASDYYTDGFGNFSVPLMQRPIDTSNIIISSFMVLDGSDASDSINDVVNNLSSNTNFYNTVLTTSGVVINDALIINLSNADVGKSDVTIDTSNNSISYVNVGSQPVNNVGVKYDIRENKINIELDRYINFESGKYKLYVFATYSYTKINVPNQLIDLRSNRFDITVLHYKDGDSPPSDIIDFLLGFLFKVKAFHSLLRKLSYTIIFTDVYNVSDFTVGGTRTQHSGTDAGELQVPPAIIPTSEPVVRGFKNSDFKMRKSVLTGLGEEHEAWKSLEDDCGVTQLGQDRVVTNTNLDLDHDDDTRAKLCDLRRNSKDYTYKGRVVADIILEQIIPQTEDVRFSACTTLGSGAYYTSSLYGNDITVNTNIESIDKSYHDKAFTRVMAFEPEVHFLDGGVGKISDLRENRFFAIRRPSLGIEKPTLFFPGCRFINMGNLETDVEISQYTFRPWDDTVSEECQENRPEIIDLNATIYIGSDGDEVLDFDQIPLKYYGNGLPQDLSFLDEYGTGNDSSNATVHSIYSTVAANPYVEDDAELVYTGDTSICVDVDVDKLFDSVNPYCECLETGGTTGGGLDYIDGYPAESGIYSVEASSLTLGTYIITDEILEGLGLSEISTVTTAINNGYFAGGGTTSTYDNAAEKLAFLTDTTAVQTSANLSEARWYLSGCNSPTNGYFAGGMSTGDVRTATADKLVFLTDTTAAQASANLSQARYGLTGCNSSTNGYFAGGSTNTSAHRVTTADKLVFSTDTTAAQASANLGQARYYLASCNSSTNGYFAGGFTGPINGTDHVVTTDKLVFSTDTTALQASADLKQSRHGLAGCNSSTNGYFAGGYTGDYVTTTDKLVFSTDTTALQTLANLSFPREKLAGCSSPSDGYFAGGIFNGAYLATTDKLDFSLDTTAAQTTANLTVGRKLHAGTQSIFPDYATIMQFQYKCGSGVKLSRSNPKFFADKPIRLDCSCSVYDCGSAELAHDRINRCNIDLFLENGEYDFDIDKLSVTPRFKFNEEVGACSILLDGTIPTLFEMTRSDNPFKFQDEYGIIYQVEYESIGNRMDITWTTYDPRVPGVVDTGRLDGINLYRNGVITTTHQITEYVNNTTDAILVAEGSEARVGEFKTSVFTNSETPIDPFEYHLNCEYVDELEFTCNGGICIGYVERVDNIIAIATSSSHGFSTGDNITINGVSDISGISPNGIYNITVVDDNNFTYENVGGDGGPVFGGWIS